ncbi:MAG: leucine-rich repeat domain-containing protein [Treponema sp.]|jgi:hypothetical protein|nr:leucine-rich repeat domain-containing protein [Treponema sp.]
MGSYRMPNLTRTVDSGEWIYYDTEEGLFICDYRGKEKNVVMPAFIDGKPVKAVLSTGNYLFYKWGVFFKKGVESVVISEGISAIEFNAFTLGDLTSVRIPSSVTRIEESAFDGNKLTDVTIPEQVTYIGSYAFSGNKLACVAIPPGVQTIGSWAFSSNCLTRAVIPPGVRDIGEWAFSYNRLADIAIPDSVTTIGNCAFMRNELTGIDLPASVTGIGGRAFAENRLTSVFIPRTLVSIGGGAFANNPALAAIVTDSENPSYTSVEGVLFSKDKTTLVSYPAGKGTVYAIPDGVTAIASFACGHSQLEQVILPASVTVIGFAAFSDNHLTSITIPPGVTTIADFAFSRNELSCIIIGMDVEFRPDGADDDFSSVYKGGGKKAGKYTKTNGVWNYAPLDKELALRYFDFKKAAGAWAKKAVFEIKTMTFHLMLIGFIPLAFPVLPKFLTRIVVYVFQFVFYVFFFIPCLCVLLGRRAIKKLRNKSKDEEG